ncbi:hypothetical protein HBI56_029340 [Parastagonospora nodorum]|uniref:Uncharacterized protein n=1 Tax=Phaeosphaeria nodorum (strain SN15 / ATCC MYA-4574 / FGSC 10173) TaxID=321614 RepID=A0A7U2I0B3_PHANO|nr:hypothetical protein HBH56_016950 [Parastagonospora nodorum]QRC95146.1 hypothetical protein JI435_431860 [Parastagonospora nodorum SN15]KAH3937505.1 hypothetical protein HBH54_017520 [Parastagonospora nodorum]KAH3953895.1 hypothetical protein HBH53_029890 [Parastagonospora nodorum]KAH3962553.1 hypothetical protein HBH51_172090 [Parastagonospora nodorum]
MAVLSTMHVCNTALVSQSQLTMARCDDRNISDAFETLPTTLLSGSDEPSALDLEDDSIVQPTVHLHGGKWHMQTDDFATTSQMGHVDAHGQPRTRGPTTIVWYCSECRDGPLGIWQNVCPSCSHIICGYCDKEEV